MRWILPLIAACGLMAVGGCSLPDPYIYKSNEFNRRLPDFGKDVPDRQSVGICYNKKNTTPQQIVQMAKDECAKYHKVATFSTQRYLRCPILTPAEAVFLCQRPGEQDGMSPPFRY